MKKNGFTLIELLAVIVIFAISFLFVIPSITTLIKSGERREIELIEERVISAAKEYVNNIDGSFFTELYKEGDVNYIYKSSLLNSGLLSEEDISKLGNFVVKGEVIKNNKIKYSIEYIEDDLSS